MSGLSKSETHRLRLLNCTRKPIISMSVDRAAKPAASFYFRAATNPSLPPPDSFGSLKGILAFGTMPINTFATGSWPSAPGQRERTKERKGLATKREASIVERNAVDIRHGGVQEGGRGRIDRWPRERRAKTR